MPKHDPKEQANRLIHSFLLQAMRGLETPEPVLIELCEQLQAKGGSEEIIEFLDKAIDCMAQARGALDHARVRLLGTAS